MASLELSIVFSTFENECSRFRPQNLWRACGWCCDEIREMCLADSDPLLVFRPRCSNRALPLIGQVLHAVPGWGSSVPTGRHVGLSAGDDRMREYSEYVACPCCGGTMRLARTVSHAEVPPLETFECKPCGLAVTAEAVSGSHALIEKSYFC